MKSLMLVISITAAALLAGCIQELPPTPPAAALGGAAMTQSPSLFGTLAPLGSFSFELAPIYTRAAVIAHEGAALLAAGQISRVDAEALHDGAQQAVSLADQARAACGEDPVSGQCARSHKAKATALLWQARAALPALPAS